MATAIYYSKIEYREVLGRRSSIILLNIPARELSYQVCEYGETFSYAISLTDKQMEALLPYCNALDFEPYRGRKMIMGEPGYIGYRDEVWLSFRAITDSYIPLLELPMHYYYDEDHIWPSEKLYRYLVRTFYEGNNAIKGHSLSYGSYSLF